MLGGVKLLLATAAPLQAIIDKPCVTHEFCNRQALAILRHEGLKSCSDYFQRYLDKINAGACWADAGWKNVNHYYEPASGKGLWMFANAVEDFNKYYNLAIKWLFQGNYGQAAFFLGAALHLVQDLCVPHHARSLLFHGHKQYEEWVRRNFNAFRADNLGNYTTGKPIRSLLHYNAVIAADFLDWVGIDAAENRYRDATAVLLPLAQRTTADTLLQYYAAVVASGYTLCKTFIVA